MICKQINTGLDELPANKHCIPLPGHAASDDQNPSVLAPSQPLEPYDAELMHRPQPAEEILKLELTKLGRGRGKFSSSEPAEYLQAVLLELSCRS